MIRALLGGALVAAGLASGAAAADFHQVFEARCARCHGHAGPFVRERLTDAGGVVRSVETGREIGPFLGRHAGGLEPDEIALFLAVFHRQLQSGGFYRERCDICHDRAYELARLRLTLRDGRLVGRYSGRDMAAFLPGHARMTPDEAARMVDALEALLRVGR